MTEGRIRGSRRFAGYERPKVEERFDYADLVRRQIERALIASSDPIFTFPNSVQALEALLPKDLKDDEYTSEFEKATQEESVLFYRTNCRVRLGRADDPLVVGQYGERGLSSDPGFAVNRLEDGSVDWSDPRIVSPKLQPKEIIDWYARFEAAFNQFVRLGIAVRRISRG